MCLVILRRRGFRSSLPSLLLCHYFNIRPVTTKLNHCLVKAMAARHWELQGPKGPKHSLRAPLLQLYGPSGTAGTNLFSKVKFLTPKTNYKCVTIWLTVTTELSTMKKLISRQWKNPPKKNPKQGASTWKILNQGAMKHGCISKFGCGCTCGCRTRPFLKK